MKEAGNPRDTKQRRHHRVVAAALSKGEKPTRHPRREETDPQHHGKRSAHHALPFSFRVLSMNRQVGRPLRGRRGSMRTNHLFPARCGDLLASPARSLLASPTRSLLASPTRSLLASPTRSLLASLTRSRALPSTGSCAHCASSCWTSEFPMIFLIRQRHFGTKVGTRGFARPDSCPPQAGALRTPGPGVPPLWATWARCMPVPPAWKCPVKSPQRRTPTPLKNV